MKKILVLMTVVIGMHGVAITAFSVSHAQVTAQSAIRTWTNEQLFERLSAGTYQPPSSNGLLLVKDGKPSAAIVIADQKDERIMLAVNELQSHIKLITGADLPIRTVDQEWTEPVIFVGKSSALKEYGVKTDDLIDDSFRIQTGKNFVAIVGGDIPVPQGTKWATSGTLHAVYDFLEKECGVRWLIPDRLGTYYTKTVTLGVPIGLNRYEKGDILWRLMPGDFNWRTRQKAGGINIYSGGGHTWGELVPLKEYWERHPEYYAFFQGERSNITDGEGNPGLCVSNPEVLKIAIGAVQNILNRGYDVVEMAQPDSFGKGVPYCHCEYCLRIGACGAQVEFFHKKIAEAIAKSHPGKYLLHLSYGPTTNPSPGLEFGKNVIIECATGSPEIWKDVPCAGCSAYVYDFANFHIGAANGPKESIAATVKLCQWFKANQIKGVYWCGFGKSWPLEGLNYYLAAKLQWNLAENPQALVDEWLKLMYGPAEPAMRKFWLGLSKIADKKLTTAESVSTAQKWVALFPPSVLDELDGYLTEATKLVGNDPAYLIRIRISKDALRFVRATEKVFSVFLDYQEEQNNIKRLQSLAEAIKERKELFEEILAERYNGEKGAYAGLLAAGPCYPGYSDAREELIRLVYNGDCTYAQIGVISSLPISTMLKYFETKKSSIATAVKVAIPPKIDGNISPGEYGRAGPCLLVDDSSGENVNQVLTTEVYLGYDHQNLYCAFVCSETLIDKLVGLQEDRELQIWRTDCVEVFVQPNLKINQNMHFMVSAGNHGYDGRYGYIPDMLDPAAYKPDDNWTTVWQHATSVDKNNKRWIVEVALPFESLGVKPPEKGDKWCVQFCRERYPDKSKLMSFSPTFGNFHNYMRFGTLIFE